MTPTGRLRERVTLQQEVRTPVGGGSNAVSWDPVATVWARVAPLQGREQLQAQQLEDALSYRVTIRYRTGITPAMRLTWRGQALNIRAVTNPDEKREFLEMLCEAGVGS